MARAAVLGRLTWRVGTVRAVRDETPTARTLVLDVPGWPGHEAGQHVDVRLTAADGYTAVRSYSLANAPDADRVELTVQQVPDGEVSPYLTQALAVGDPLEIRGPVGGWFVWRPDQPEPVQLVAGGSGIVPLMAMVRAHGTSGGRAPMRLLYSVRDPASALYRAELADRAASDGGPEVTYAYTRAAPPGWPRTPGRIDADLLAAATWPPEAGPSCYVCGPTGFVERVADLLVAAGHEPTRIRTERFGPSGGSP
ncbi:ferredoxin reductase [Thermomonospora cellulosilytica]|uniref:Ferredoxin-NADP reductase n=1 Tax=Thermomonospora cellulosilytica TaxID=1411118 RepID=A0A7W3R8B7_9ACTN|nr:ferredoxin reductase [Thermomonospora cellulosilytica]MBA9003497.1 ferredoxin-NADP reductase [Thermomonospora cellulosilytica]